MNKNSNKEANDRWWIAVLYVIYGEVWSKIKNCATQG